MQAERSAFLAGISKLRMISPKRLPILQMKTFPQPMANNDQERTSGGSCLEVTLTTRPRNTLSKFSHPKESGRISASGLTPQRCGVGDETHTPDPRKPAIVLSQ